MREAYRVLHRLMKQGALNVLGAFESGEQPALGVTLGSTPGF